MSSQCQSLLCRRHLRLPGMLARTEPAPWCTDHTAAPLQEPCIASTRNYKSNHLCMKTFPHVCRLSCSKCDTSKQQSTGQQYLLVAAEMARLLKGTSVRCAFVVLLVRAFPSVWPEPLTGACTVEEFSLGDVLANLRPVPACCCGACCDRPGGAAALVCRFLFCALCLP